MTSKSSSFNCIYGCFREDLRRRLWSIALCILVFFFALPVTVSVTISSLRGSMFHQQNPALAPEILEIYAKRELFRLYQNLIGPDSGWLSVLLGVLAIVLAISGFAWLFSARQTDFYHALPIRREKLFLVVLVNGILIAAVPYGVMSVISALIILFSTGRKLALVLALTGFLYHMAQFLFVYAAAVTAVMLTGTLIVSVLAALTLMGYGPLLVFSINALFSQYFITYLPMNSLQLSWLQHSSPFLYGISLDPGSSGWLLKGIIAFVWFVLLTALNLFLYKKRPSEAAGRAICFDVTRGPIRIALSVLAGLSVSVLIRELLAGAAHIDAWVVFAAFCAVAVTGCVIEIIFHADFRKLFASPLRLMLSLALTFLILAVFRFDLAGYDLYLPAADSIASAGVYTEQMESNLWELHQNVTLEENLKNGQYYTQYQNDENVNIHLIDRMQLDDPTTVLSIAQAGIQSLKTQPEAALQQDQDLSHFGVVLVSYHLKNGRVLRRRYPITDLTRIRAQLDAVHDSAAFKEACYPVLSMNPESLFGANYQVPDGYYHVPLSSADESQRMQLEQLLTTYQEELLSLTADTRRKEYPVACIQFKDHSFQNMVDIIRAQENGYIGIFNEMQYYPVYPSFTKTLSLLEKSGVDLSDPMRVKDVRAVKIYDCRSFFDGELDHSGARNLQTLVISDPEQVSEILSCSHYTSLIYSNALYPFYDGLDVYAAYDPAAFAEDQRSEGGADAPIPTEEYRDESMPREIPIRMDADKIPSFLIEHYNLKEEDIQKETYRSY